MAELWALLHFIMPQLFDSEAQFHEWFSKGAQIVWCQCIVWVLFSTGEYRYIWPQPSVSELFSPRLAQAVGNLTTYGQKLPAPYIATVEELSRMEQSCSWATRKLHPLAS